ncbi:MAG TPA: sigma factor-like helix-turn-helix DNA-binding protein [Kofleriaceae bacterium]|nr:sigma factor-like helix-turn-helix DNA-binding protein [Kofleriaceae bacterium]
MGDDEITVAWDAGRAAWPGVTLDRERFAAHASKLDPGGAQRFPADVYLAAACLTADPAALAAFDRELVAAARGAIHEIVGTPTLVDEALQRMRASLLVGDDGTPKLASYAARGPLRAWVGIAGARTALMMLRSQKRAREVIAPDDDNEWISALATISTNNPELELLKRQYTTAFGTALRDAVTALEPRHRAVLRMSFVDALSIDEIGTVYAVHRATAARWIQRACDGVFAETRRLLAERLALSVTELDRMTALVQSQLEVSLSQLLPRGATDDA